MCDHEQGVSSGSNNSETFDELFSPICRWAFVLTAIVCAGLLGDGMRRQELKQQQARVQRQADAELLHDRGLVLFDQLDKDGDGMLFEEELRNLHLEETFQGEDAKIVKLLYEGCKDIGHVFGRYPSGKFQVAVYAISKVDLKHYPEKVAEDIRNEKD